MSADVLIQGETQRYQAVLRISEALFACQTCEELARILADQLGKVLSFDDLEVIVFKENSKEIEWQVCAKGRLGAPEAPVEELPAWHVYDSQDTLLISDWNTDERFPRLKQLVAKTGVEIGSVVRVPLMTPYQRLGTLGIASRRGTTYRADDIGFLRLIARVVALAIEDRLNLTKEQEARAELQRQNDRLQLLLNVTNRITSNLGLRELLRAVSANIREVMHGDVVAISLPDAAPGQFRVFAMDFPHGKGFAREELLVMQPAKDLLDSMKPVVVDWRESEGFPSEAYAIAAAEGVKLSCIIPPVNHGRVLGRLSISRRTETSFTPDEVEFLSQISGQIAIAVENALAYREISELKDKLAQEKLYLEEEIRNEMNFEQIIGNSSTLKHVLQLVETVAPSDSTVLLLGETGTGKALIARAIHDRSQRKDRTLVKLNCAAIPTGLLESELFGHERGAFTGAIGQKIGRMELADKGTLFLDEVGDIPVEIQPKLLRALQEREFERLGSTHTRRVNVRLVAATNRDLEKMIAAREFRQDLFYRLNVFPIRVPPLRERREDIPQLVSYFVQKFAKQMQKKIEAISPAVMKGLTAWDWPGNIRELENFIERAVIVTRGKSLEAPVGELRKTNTVAFPHAAQNSVEQVAGERTDSQSDQTSVADEYERRQRDEIVRALTACNGRVGGADGAAARLGMNRTTFLSPMNKFGIYAK